MTFSNWFAQVDNAAEQTFGLSVHDLPDGTWRDYFDDGLSPQEAVEAYTEDNPETFSEWF